MAWFSTLTTRITGWTSSLSSRLRLRKTEPFNGSRKKSRYSAPPICFFYVVIVKKKLLWCFRCAVGVRDTQEKKREMPTSVPCISNGCIDSCVLINSPHRFRSDFQPGSLGKSRVVAGEWELSFEVVPTHTVARSRKIMFFLLIFFHDFVVE